MVNAVDNASGILAWVNSQMAALNGMTSYVYVKAVQEPGAPAVGGRNVLATGGIMKYYAAGGMDVPNGHQAEIVPKGNMRVWAEPETDGEAYIPYRRDTRGRSERILAQVANDFGYRLTKAVEHYATGGAPTQASVMTSGGGMSAAVVSLLQALLTEIRAMRANSDPWKAAQLAKMHERTR